MIKPVVNNKYCEGQWEIAGGKTEGNCDRIS